MYNTAKYFTIGLMTLGLSSFGSGMPDSTEQDQTQQVQDQRQQETVQQQQEDQEQRQTQQQQEEQRQVQQKCGVEANSYLEIFVSDPCARIYLQGNLIKTQRSHHKSFIVPGLETCKKYPYNVIVTHGNHAKSFDFKLEANQIRTIEVP